MPGRPALFWLALALTPLVVAEDARAANEAAPTASEILLSLQGMDCSGCWLRAQKELLTVPGVTGAKLDTRTVVATITTSKPVEADSLIEAVARAGFGASLGAGSGKWSAPKGYPTGSDVAIVSHDGSVIGELADLAVPGKVTLVDLYADWCAPCRMIDAHVAKILATRSDIAVRKVNIVKWGSPAAKMYLGKVASIPQMLVYGKDGAYIETVLGYLPKKLQDAIDKGAGLENAASSGGTVEASAAPKTGSK
jgi:thiol-disulfide isomerase/thioredoxin